MPELFANREGFANPEDCEEFIVTKGMRERKAKLDEISDAVIAVAGGFGTLEELSEMMVQKQLGYNHKPIVILNTNGFYNDLVKFFDRISGEKFAKENTIKTYYVTNSHEDAINYINKYVPDYSLDRFAKLKQYKTFIIQHYKVNLYSKYSIIFKKYDENGNAEGKTIYYNESNETIATQWGNSI